MASRSLGTLTLDLVAKIGGFTDGLSKAEREAEKRFAGINAAAKKMGVALGATLAAAGLGAAAALKATIDKMDEMSKSAARVGLNTEEFSRLAYAGSLADVSMDTLVSTLGKLTKAQAAALKDTSEQSRVFEALGISVTDAEGKLRSSNDVLLDFADTFAALGGSPEAMAAGFSLFGRSFQEMVPLIKDGSGALREMFAESDRLGATLSTEAGQAAEAFNDDLTRLQTSVSGLTMQFASGLVPTLADITQGMTDSADATNSARDAGKALGESFGVLASIAGGVVSIIRTVTYTITEMMNQAAAWYEIVSNIGTLGIAPGTVKGGFETSAKGWSDLAGMVRGEWSGPEKKAAGIPQIKFAGTDEAPDGMFRMSDAQVRAQKQSDEIRKRVQSALGGAEKKSSGRRSGGGASIASREAEEAIREAQRAAEAQERWRGTVLDLEATLSGPLAVAEREYTRNTEQLTAAFHSGEVALADYAKGMDAYKAQRDAEIKTINDRKTPAQEMLADMQFEAELIGKTREEQELLNAARRLGAEAATEQGKAALAAMKENQEALRAFGEQAAFMDGVRGEFNDFFMDVFTGTKSLKDAFADLFDGIAAMITQKIVSGWIDKLFGGPGSSGAGTSGGNIFGSILGMFFGGKNANGNAFMGGRVVPFANGGVVTAPQFFPMSGGRTGLMGEAGPEAIMPLKRGPDGKLGVRMSGGVGTINQTINVPRGTEYRSAAQVGQAALMGAQRAASRNR